MIVQEIAQFTILNQTQAQVSLDVSTHFVDAGAHRASGCCDDLQIDIIEKHTQK